MASPVRYKDEVSGLFSECREIRKAFSTSSELIGLLIVPLPEVLPKILVC